MYSIYIFTFQFSLSVRNTLDWIVLCVSDMESWWWSCCSHLPPPPLHLPHLNTSSDCSAVGPPPPSEASEAGSVQTHKPR